MMSPFLDGISFFSLPFLPFNHTWSHSHKIVIPERFHTVLGMFSIFQCGGDSRPHHLWWCVILWALSQFRLRLSSYQFQQILEAPAHLPPLSAPSINHYSPGLIYFWGHIKVGIQDSWSAMVGFFFPCLLEELVDLRCWDGKHLFPWQNLFWPLQIPSWIS